MPHVGLLYGGQSAEHEVSILSAVNVAAALAERHRVTPIYIDRDGRWRVTRAVDGGEGDRLCFWPHAGGDTLRVDGLGGLGLDVVFPVLHGHNGEDGTIQGFLHTLGLPFVGPDVLASAACMDKAVAKRLLEAAGLATTPYLVTYAHHDRPDFATVQERLGPTVFVKPANSGSSVGVSRVEAEAEWGAALDDAFRYDKTVVVETGIEGREIEVAVLGNERPEASVPGEIVITTQFYDYDSKYTDPDASRMEVPADLDADTTARVRELAVDAYVALGCEGLGRVDFFVTGDGEILVNEINTIPGFTARSMYPVMWAATGRSNEQLADDLVQLALDRHARDARRKLTR
ncbi:D-alanine--D-alanine ligase family protein [Rubrivirga sp. IMCC43871]|uniref:D-alanine--D-alanine ligase family protein n=1 Tax=Rubrivirga sp. IMCC43871 TaxID=3391575 RepID=UPI00398F9D13